MYKHQLTELLQHVADGSVSPEEAALKLKMQPFQEIGEYATVTSSLLFNIAVSSHPMGLVDTMSVSDKLYVCQTNVIRDLADKGPCVIVGRCADFILKDRPDCLHIFVHSDYEHRAARVLARYG